MKERYIMNITTMLFFCAIFSALWWLKSKWPWLANLPGDMKIPVGNGYIVLPLATSLIASIIVMIIMALACRKP